MCPLLKFRVPPHPPAIVGSSKWSFLLPTTGFHLSGLCVYRVLLGEDFQFIVSA